MSTIPRTGTYVPSKWGAEFHARRENEVFGAGAAGPGKALCLNTLVPTPDGLRYFRDIKPGSTVFDIHGAQVKVIAETEVFTNRECYKVKIGQEYIIADAEHQWVVENYGIKTTKEIHNSPFKFFIPAPGPAEMKPRLYEVDPYVLGVCIAMGQPKDRSKFTTWDPDLYHNMKEVGYTLEDVGYKVAMVVQRRDAINELVSESDRRIPEHYMLGSFNQRMALVEGIVDGCGGKTPTIKERDKGFLLDFIRLCSSVGLGPSVSYSKHLRVYFIQIKSTKYRCSRRPGVRAAKNQEATRTQISRVERVESVPTKCIQVSGSGTFLVTKSYIPTHNSMVLLADPLEQVWIEHIRCQQGDIPESFPDNLKQIIQRHPLKWGNSEGWILHLRRTMPRLDETINRAHRMFPQIDPDAQWSEKKSTWTFSSGIKYQFGHCKDRTDYNNYLGKQYTYLGWDELVEFNKEQYDFISSRLRTGDPVLRHLLKNRSMSNPRLSGNKGEDISVDDPAWVKRYFVDPWPEGRKILRKRVKRRDGSMEDVTRVYLPATLYDNPDPEFVKQYELQLMARPKHIRDCYLYGKWDTIIGSHFGEDWNPTIHVCKPFKIPPDWPVFRAMDWGYKTNGCIGYYAINPEGTIYKFFEIVFKDKTADVVAKSLIKPFEQKNKLWSGEKGSLIYGPADTQIWEERGENAKTKYQHFTENGIDWCRADKKSRADNAETLSGMLTSHENYTKNPGIVFFENCKMTIQVIPAMETDPNHPEEPKKGGFDHPYDETTYGVRYATNAGIIAPNYKGDVEFTDDFDDDLDGERGQFGYWQG